MVKAGLPILNVLGMLRDQLEHPELKIIVEEIKLLEEVDGRDLFWRRLAEIADHIPGSIFFDKYHDFEKIPLTIQMHPGRNKR